MPRKLTLAISMLAPTLAFSEPVTIETYVRAESDTMFRANMAAAKVSVGQLAHLRKPTMPDNQPVIRMNQDTLYSGILLDLTHPAQITLPEVGGRYMSMQVVNQDHFMFVESEPGTYQLTQEDVGSRFTLVSFRTFVDVTDPDDVKATHVAQDGITVSGGGTGPFDAPDWDPQDLAKARGALSNLAELGFSTYYAFGTPEDTRPVDHLVGAAAGWGGLPRTAALYVIDSVDTNDGETPHSVSVKDVPVDAFWSVTVYNSDGYLESNDLGVNSYNSNTARPSDEGVFMINFGACVDGRENCIPITPGWSYTVRLYQPRAEILDGAWEFPKPQPIE